MWAGISEVLDGFADAMVVVNGRSEVLCLNAAAREILGVRLEGLGAYAWDAASGMVRVFHTSQSKKRAEDRGFLLVRSRTGLRFVSAGCQELLGLEEEGLLAGELSLESAFLAEDRRKFLNWRNGEAEGRLAGLEVRAVGRNGELRRLKLRLRQAQTGEDGEWLEVLWCDGDQAEKRQAKPEEQQGLVDVASFREELDQCVEVWRQGQENSIFALAMLQYSRWRLIEPGLGPEAAWEAMTEAAFRLESAIEPGDVIAKFGEAEYGLLLRGLPSRQAAEARLRRVLGVLNLPFERGERSFALTARAGLAYPENLQTSGDDLLRDADAALEQAKRRKQIFSSLRPQKEAPQPHILAMEMELRQAIERDEILFEFQPVYHVSDGRIVMLEALSRWRHPRLGEVAPTSFIAAAEDSGLVLQMDVKGLERLAAQIGAWKSSAALPPELIFTINMSGCHFPAFVNERRILDLLEQEPLRSARIAFEVTETAFLEGDAVTVGHFRRLREAGVEIWLDDFGEGHSSLRYLLDFPVDGIKVSEVFVRRAVEQPKARAILASIRKLTHSLGLGLVAEGIETREQWELMRNLGYEAVQGYYYSPALPAEEILRTAGMNWGRGSRSFEA